MDDSGSNTFVVLFKEACLKCFGHSLQQPLTETESKLFYNHVLEDTGLVIGWKSLKNYSFFVLNEKTAKQENPSTATLDTLARYVLNAPYTTEAERKSKESHYPYWFQYKERLYANEADKKIVQPNKSVIKPVYFLIALIVIIALFFAVFVEKNKAKNFTDNFHSIDDDTLQAHGWFIHSKDTVYWKRRNEIANMLSLYTLEGDNWPDTVHTQDIKNLLLRKINAECFTAEVHLQDFFPEKEWQQAGVILLEDTNFTGKSLRLSIAYNDYFGGFNRPKEVIIQAITSPGNGLSKPEEIAHVQVFTLDSSNESLVQNNLKYSGLRIEKKNSSIRLLYSCSPAENFAFKEAATTEFTFQPKYIGVFALKGFVKDTSVMPVAFSYFTTAGNSCRN
jgi:hypothetical protein